MKSEDYRAVAFIGLYIFAVTLGLKYWHYIDDLGSFFGYLGLIQMPFFWIAYVYLDSTFRSRSFFVGRLWAMPLIFLCLALALYIPISIGIMFIIAAFGKGA